MATNFSLNEYLTIDTTGSVGIGTNNPTGRLQVTGSTTGTSTTLLVKHGVANGPSLPVLDVQNSAGSSLFFVSGSGGVGIGTNTPGSRLLVSGSSTSTTPTALIQAGVPSPTGAVLDLQSSAGTSLMHVSGSGNVGIGTVNASQLLHLHAGSLLINTTGTGTNNDIYIGRAGGFATNETHSLNAHYNSATSPLIAGTMEFLFDGTKENINFRNLYNGGASTAIAMTIQGTGNVGIGTSTAAVRFAVSGSSTSNVPTMVVKEGTIPANSTGAFDVQNYTGTSLLFVSGSGYVGIGTNSMLQKLHIQTATASANDGLYMTNGSQWFRALVSGSTSAYNNIALAGDTLLIFSGSKASLGNNGLVIAPWDNTGGVGSPVSGLRMDASGSVGIGTTQASASGVSLKLVTYDATNSIIGSMSPGGAGAASSVAAFGNTTGTKYMSMGYTGAATAASERAYLRSSSATVLDINSTMFFSTAGKVAIGSSPGSISPFAVFEVTGSGNTSSTATMSLVNSSNVSTLYVRDDGNVGIGTSIPTSRVHIGSVIGTNAGGPALKLNHGAGSGYGFAQFGDSATASQNWHMGSDGSGNFITYSGIWGTGTERMRIDSSGNVGINTTAASGIRLEAYDTSSAQIRANANGTVDLRMNASTTSGGIVGTYSAQPLVLFTNSVEQMRITSAGAGLGKVGIGTATPSTKLHVSGDNITVDNNYGLEFSTVANAFTGSQNATDGSKINYYSYGTYVAAVSGSSGGAMTVTSSNKGTYTRIGHVVAVNAYFKGLTIGTATGNAIVSLPFTASSGGPGAAVKVSVVSTPSVTTYGLHGYIVANSSVITLTKWTGLANAPGAIPCSDLVNGVGTTEFYITAIYHTG